MQFQDALNIKNEIASNFLFRKSTPITVSFSLNIKSRSQTAKTMKESINGVGVSETEEGESCIKILTKEKLKLSPRELATYFGVDERNLYIQHVGLITHMPPRPRSASPRGRHRPFFPGISCGHYKITAGTIGCIVEDKAGVRHILSNNHVLANTNDSSWEDPILQPGNYDGGTAADEIARLTYYVELTKGKPNEMDAAIARINTEAAFDTKINQTITVTGVTSPVNKLNVEKYGRTTGYTKGSVTTRSLDLQVDYDGVVYDFENQCEIMGDIVNGRRTKFCSGGDSGSLILESGTNKAVALLFAGNDTGTTFATPIAEVLKVFEVKIL